MAQCTLQIKDHFTATFYEQYQNAMFQRHRILYKTWCTLHDMMLDVHMAWYTYDVHGISHLFIPAYKNKMQSKNIYSVLTK